MARLTKIRRENPLSDFSRVTPEAGHTFRMLAEMANEAYDFLEPAAIAEQEQAGAEAGREYAKQQYGDNRVPLPMQERQPRTTLGDVNNSGHSDGNMDPEAVAAWGRLEGIYGGNLPINGITSTYRSPEHNAKVGGAKHSQHMHGRAYDINVSNLSNDEQIELIKNARAAGFRGIGVYGSSLHFDTGPDRHWGPSYGADSLPSWAAEAVRAPVGVAGDGTLTGGNFDDAESVAEDAMEVLAGDDTTEGGSMDDMLVDPAVTPPPEPETTVRTKAGKIEPRLYSPLSGKILQAHNAAFGIAYMSETADASITELMSLSYENEGNPDGFKNSAQAYIEGVVEQAPEMFRSDLQGMLSEEVQRRYLGMVDERHREIRKRADNSSRALVQRYSKDYAEALAAGRTEEANALRGRLEDTLYARESLPGVAWTRAQSENILIGAMDDADILRKRAATEQAKEWKEQLDLIIDARKDGRSAADETILDNPSVWGAQPDKAREAAAWVAFGELRPDFIALPPAERDRQLREEKSRPVSEGYELDFLGAMEGMHKSANAALQDDPVAFGRRHLSHTDMGAPPDLNVATALADPTGFSKALAAREEWAIRMRDAGYTKGVVALDKNEAEALSGILSGDQDPMQRAMVVSMMADSAPGALGAILNQAGVDDVLKFGGQMAAATGDVRLLEQAIRGQDMIAAKQVRFPENAGRMTVVAPEMSEAMEGLPAAGEKQSRVMAFAKALYATEAVGVEEREEQVALLNKAVNKALGQSVNAEGNLTGGVQDVNGFQTLLPVGMTAAEFAEVTMLNSAEALGPSVRFTFDEGMSLGLNTGQTEDDGFDIEAWARASRYGSAPMFRTNPITGAALSADRMRFISTGGNFYRMEYHSQFGAVDVTNENGTIYEFDIRKLREGG